MGKAQYNVMQSRDSLIQKGIEAVGVFSLKDALQNYTKLKPTHAFFSVTLGASKIDSMAAMFKKSLLCDCYIYPDDANNREAMAELKNSSVQFKMKFNVTGVGIYRIVEPWLRQQNDDYQQQEKERQKQKQAARDKIKKQLKNIAPPKDNEKDEDDEKLKALKLAEELELEQKRKARALKRALKKKHAKRDKEAEEAQKVFNNHWSEKADNDKTAVPPVAEDEIDISNLLGKTRGSIQSGHVSMKSDADVAIGSVRVIRDKSENVGSVHVVADKITSGGEKLEEFDSIDDQATDTVFKEIELSPEEFPSFAMGALDSDGEITIDVTPVASTEEVVEIETPAEPQIYFEGPNVGMLHLKSDDFNGYAIFLFSEASPNQDMLKLRIEDHLKLYLNKNRQRPHDQSVSVGISDFESSGETLEFLPLLSKMEGEHIVFMEGENTQPSINPSAQPEMISIEASRLHLEFKVTFDVFIRLDLNQKYVKYLASGEKLTEAQREKLLKRNVDRVHIKLANKEKFENYCKLAFIWSLTKQAA